MTGRGTGCCAAPAGAGVLGAAAELIEEELLQHDNIMELSADSLKSINAVTEVGGHRRGGRGGVHLHALDQLDPMVGIPKALKCAGSAAPQPLR